MSQFFVIINGSKQGQFKGELNEAGHTAEIGGLRLSMELDIPHDAATGHASGKRQYQPITSRKNGVLPLLRSCKPLQPTRLSPPCRFGSCT